MPSIYYLNPPPNPFWDFVAGLDDHPLWRGPPGRGHPFGPGRSPPPPPPAATAAQENVAQPQSEKSEKAQGKQPYVEDPPEVDPSTVKPEAKKSDEASREKPFPFRGRGRFSEAFNDDEKKGREECRKERAAERDAAREAHRAERCADRADRDQRRCRGGRGGRFGPYGPPPFMSGHPFFSRPPWAQGEFRGPPGPGPEHTHPPHHPSHGPHPHGLPPHMRSHHRRPSPPQTRPSFDLSDFLTKLGSKLGVDLTQAAEGLGLAQDRFTAGRTSPDVNFEPRADIFENKDFYTVHLSLPGAKKSDVGVEYEGDHSILRITGVVHRPDVDEQMMSELIVDGRKRETGVFEKAIRLGTKRDPANIDVAGIHAKMTDGVLVVRIPKIEKKEGKREVTVTTDSGVGYGTTSTAAGIASANKVATGPAAPGAFPPTPRNDQPDYDNDYSEKPALFDADNDDQVSVVTASEAAGPVQREPISLIDMKDNDRYEDKEPYPSTKETEAEAEKERNKDKDQEEELPAYTTTAANEEDDWERFSDDSGEGEYIKIDVK